MAARLSTASSVMNPLVTKTVPRPARRASIPVSIVYSKVMVGSLYVHEIEAQPEARARRTASAGASSGSDPTASPAREICQFWQCSQVKLHPTEPSE